MRRMGPSLKLKIYDREISPDQAILAIEGGALCLQGAAMLGSPTQVQVRHLHTSAPALQAGSYPL